MPSLHWMAVVGLVLGTAPNCCLLATAAKAKQFPYPTELQPPYQQQQQQQQWPVQYGAPPPPPPQVQQAAPPGALVQYPPLPPPAVEAPVLAKEDTSSLLRAATAQVPMQDVMGLMDNIRQLQSREQGLERQLSQQRQQAAAAQYQSNAEVSKERQNVASLNSSARKLAALAQASVNQAQSSIDQAHNMEANMKKRLADIEKRLEASEKARSSLQTELSGMQMLMKEEETRVSNAESRALTAESAMDQVRYELRAVQSPEGRLAAESLNGMVEAPYQPNNFLAVQRSSPPLSSADLPAVAPPEGEPFGQEAGFVETDVASGALPRARDLPVRQ